ncbi:trp operon leader peptide [Salmonella enterica]|nr:trp operon leader peptide [Salmonella enterica]
MEATFALHGWWRTS